MSKDSNSNGSASIINGLLGIAFVVLKLTGVINWSWWWVTLPFWGGIVFVLAILIVTMLVIAFTEQPVSRQVKKSNFQERLNQMKKEREQ